MTETSTPDDHPADRSTAPLRIAMVAPPWFELPPRGYGGTEAVVAALVDQLVRDGHEVVLVGAGVHHTLAQRFVRVLPTPPTALLGDPVPEVIVAAAAARALDELDVDVVHDHTLAGPLLARGRRVPTVATTHGPVTGLLADYYSQLGESVRLVSISHAQRASNPLLSWCGTVHNAVDVGSFAFRDRKDDYVLWIGRFNPDKGPHLAIDAARAHGLRIVLAGKLNEAPERAFFDAAISPRLGPGVEYVGEADAALKRELYAGARALLFPIQWDEPFGMVMVEAMASGTPVLAIGRGAAPEVVEHGRSGLVVRDFDEFVAAVPRVLDLDPYLCREVASERFDLPVMAAGYAAVYRRLAEGQPPGLATPWHRRRPRAPRDGRDGPVHGVDAVRDAIA